MKSQQYLCLFLFVFFTTISTSLATEAPASCLCSGEGHLQSLRLSYVGGSCSQSDHAQDSSKAPCQGDAGSTEVVRILAASRTDLSHKKTLITFDGLVPLNTSFFVEGNFNRHNKVSPNTSIWIYNLAGELLQELSFHSSCSVPLNPGDRFGSLILQNGSRNGDLIVDDCGVCGGDGSSCVDCAGRPDGNTVPDACGVCGGNNECFDCAGVPSGSAVVDECGICGGDGSTCTDCAGVPFGTARVDLCGVCGGNNECIDCAGVPFGNAVVDECGVCNGDNSCMKCGVQDCDCLGTPGGTATVDECGVCGGTNECVDCAGTPFGLAEEDLCGVCDGTNDCVDCFGIPFGGAELDQCGVCGGDGSSCVSCNEINLSALQGSLDGSGHAMKSLVNNAIRKLRRFEKRKALKEYTSMREQAYQHYLPLWQLAYSFPPVVQQCNVEVLCAEVNLTSTAVSYNEGVDQMHNLLTSVLRRMKKAARKTGNSRARMLSKRIQKAFQKASEQAQAALDLLPKDLTICSLSESGP